MYMYEQFAQLQLSGLAAVTKVQAGAAPYHAACGHLWSPTVTQPTQPHYIADAMHHLKHA